MAWCDDLTLISQAGAPDAVYHEVERAFSANEIVALTLAIVAINGWNRLAISMRAPVGDTSHRAALRRARRPSASGYATRTSTNRE